MKKRTIENGGNNAETNFRLIQLSNERKLLFFTGTNDRPSDIAAHWWCLRPSETRWDAQSVNRALKPTRCHLLRPGPEWPNHHQPRIAEKSANHNKSSKFDVIICWLWMKKRPTLIVFWNTLRVSNKEKMRREWATSLECAMFILRNRGKYFLVDGRVVLRRLQPDALECRRFSDTAWHAPRSLMLIEKLNKPCKLRRTPRLQSNSTLLRFWDPSAQPTTTIAIVAGNDQPKQAAHSNARRPGPHRRSKRPAQNRDRRETNDHSDIYQYHAWNQKYTNERKDKNWTRWLARTKLAEDTITMRSSTIMSLLCTNTFSVQGTPAMRPCWRKKAKERYSDKSTSGNSALVKNKRTMIKKLRKSYQLCNFATKIWRQTCIVWRIDAKKTILHLSCSIMEEPPRLMVWYCHCKMANAEAPVSSGCGSTKMTRNRSLARIFSRILSSSRWQTCIQQKKKKKKTSENASIAFCFWWNNWQ